MIIYCKEESIDRTQKKIKIFGLKIYEKKIINSISREIVRKYFYGILKIKTDKYKKKFYLLGLKIFKKKIYGIREQLIDVQSKLEILNDINIKEIRQCIIEETRMANAISNLHSKVFSQFKNKHSGQDIVIVGTGPTLNFYNSLENGIHIGLNKAFLCARVKLDYSFAVDFGAVCDYIKELKNYDCIKFLGMHSNINLPLYDPIRSIYTHIPEYIIEEVGAYRFYSDAHRIKFHYNIEQFPLIDRGSVAFPALHFALHTHPKRIFLVGLDTSLNGYYDKKGNNSDWWLLSMALDGYKNLKRFIEIYYPDIEIISVNPVGLKGLFRDVYTKEYIEENPEIIENSDSTIEYLDDVVRECDYE